MGDKKLDKRFFYAIPFIILLGVILVVSFVPSSPNAQVDNSNVKNSIDREGYFCITTTGDFIGRETSPHEGINEIVGCTHNLLTTAGQNGIEDMLRLGTGSAYDYIALCNSTAACTPPAAGDTTLDNELAAGGFTRAQGTTGDNGNGNWSVWKTFTSTAAYTITTNMTGLFNASSGGTLMAENSFTEVSLENSDQLTINTTIDVS